MNHKEIIDRHHLLEIILWPNGYGTFRTILNSRKQLKELGIYDDFKLTIPLTHSEHMSLHHKDNKHFYRKHHSKDTRKKISDAMKYRTGNRNPMYGKTFSDESKSKISEALKAAWARRKHCV